MYTIFYNDSYIYDPYENLECVTDVKLTANVNAAAYLDFTISPKHPLYNIVEERSGIVKVYYDNEKLFEGVVDSIEMDMYGYKSISCVSALDYLGDTRTRSYHTGSVEPTDKSKGVKAPESINQFFQWLIDQHNQHVQNSNKTFIVGVNQGASFSESNIIDVESTSHESTADAITNNLIDRYGGYLTLTYDGEQRVLNLYSDVHEMNAQIMDFGVNITDFTKTTTTEDQYTAVYPVGGTPENKKENDKNTYPPIDISSLPNGTTEQDADIVKSGDVIFSRSAVARYGYKEYYYSENNILDAKNLLKAAIIALRKSMSPKVSIDVKAIDCALFMKGYHHLAVGEAVRVRSNPHKVDEYLMVSSIELDLQNPENTEYTLGTSYDTLTGQQSSYLRSLNSTINSAVDSVDALDKTSKETAKTAQEAKANSIVAKDTANTAKDTADTAKNTADTANTTANKAQNTANSAKDTADKAQTAAADAKAVADSANKATEELKKKTAEIDKQVEAASNAADAASAKADQVRTDLTNQVQNVKTEMDTAVEAAQTSANKAQSAADAAQKAADKANVSTADLDKSIKAVDAKAIAAKQAAAEAQSKAENVASDLDSANAVIEQHTTELGELTTKVSNAVKKSDSALSVSTEAKQTATEASTTATSAYKDSQTALTQSTTATQTATAAKTTAESASKTASDSLKQSSAAVQTANQISTTLRTEYQTKADADKIYATQSSLKQTSDSITASVSKTYATKDALSALQNVADNAIESWRGTGVPTLENKPASDWTTNDDKKKHSGDLYYDKSTGKAYRFGSDDGVTYTWELNQDTDVTKALEDASKAQTSANNAQASATAANTAAGKAQSTANTAVSNAATAKNAADAAQSSANKAQGDVDKLKIDIPETYATKSSLSQTAESITANVESVKTTANSAVTAASKAQQTADGISVNLTKNYQTKSQADTLYATKASLKATSDSISAEVTKAQGTADGAVTAASKAQQTADAVTLNLSKNYQTKAQNDALYATQTSLKATSDSLSANITANAKTAQSAVDKATSLEANLNGFKTTVAETYQTKDGMSDYATNSSLTQTADSIKAQVTEVSKTANGAMSKATTVEQTANGLSSKITEQAKTLNATVKTANEAKSTADSNKATISQVSTTASSALTKASSVEQNLNGFKTTVSETYGRGSNLWVNPTFDADKPQITSRVSNVTAPNGSGVNLLANRDHHNNNTSFPVVPRHKYVITAHVKRIKGNLPLHAGIWYTAQTAGHAYDTYTATESTSDLSDGWISATWRFSCPDGKSRGCVFFQIEQSASNGSTQWYISNVTCVDVTGLQPAGDYSTKSYVDQTAKSVALGVVQNYKGSDGSGLATKSDITVAKDSITTTVSKTYQTKADMKNYATQSQLTQTNDKVTIAFRNSQSVGGQNLLLKTSVPTVVTGSGAANQCVAYYSLAVGSLKNLPVGMYHMQFKIKSDTAGGTAYAQWNASPWGLGSSTKVNIGTTEQIYSVDYYITNNNYPDAKQMTVRLDNAKGEVTIREMKLERGNSMTPWTAAPEDTINDLTNTVQNQADALGKTVDSDTFNKYTSDTNNTLTHNKNDLDNLSNTVSNEIKYREAYIEFGTDLTNPYMDMGTAGNMAKLHLTNTELDFMQANAKVAWFSNQQLVVNNSTVNDSLTIGNFVFRYRSNGHLTLQHI
jgi:methyl-accepting chemotaxis protein